MSRPDVKWSKNHDCCIGCKSTEKKHHAHGRCVSCDVKWRYSQNPEYFNPTIMRSKSRWSQYINRDATYWRRGLKGKDGWRNRRVYDNLMGEGTSYTVEPFTIDGEPHVVVVFDSTPSPIQWKTEELRRIA